MRGIETMKMSVRSVNTGFRRIFRSLENKVAHLFRQGLVVSCRIREKVERYMIERTAFATTQIVLAFSTLADLYRCFVVNHYDMNSIFAKVAHFQLPTKEKCQNLTN
jgi:hypothetical protein